MTSTNYCLLCKHIGDKYLHRTSDIPCKAYPTGIPNEIFLAKILHIEVLIGQEGNFIFTPKEGYEWFTPKVHISEDEIKLPPLSEMLKKLREIEEGEM